MTQMNVEKLLYLQSDLLIASVVQTVVDNSFCTEDCIHDLTKSKRNIRLDSEAHTRQRTTLRRTE